MTSIASLDLRRQFCDPLLKLAYRTRQQEGGMCWEWTGARSKYGYGAATFRRRTLHAHRLAYRLACGVIPPGFFVCHSCDNRLCVRPAHLFIGTPFVNSRDRSVKGRSSRGMASVTKAKLTPEQVVAIRGLIAIGTPYMEIGTRYGVKPGTISNIKARRTWGWVA